MDASLRWHDKNVAEWPSVSIDPFFMSFLRRQESMNVLLNFQHFLLTAQKRELHTLFECQPALA